MNFFRHSTVKKTSLPLPAERLSCLYIEWFAYKYAIGGEDFWKSCVFVSKFLVYRREIKNSKTLTIILSEKKIDSTREHYTSFALVTR